MEALTRIYIPLEESERKALIQFSLAEKRDPRKQAALFVRRELERLGLLPPTPKQEVTDEPSRN